MITTVRRQNGLPLNMSSALLNVQEGIETEIHQLGERWRRKEVFWLTQIVQKV